MQIPCETSDVDVDLMEKCVFFKQNPLVETRETSKWGLFH